MTDSPAASGFWMSRPRDHIDRPVDDVPPATEVMLRGRPRFELDFDHSRPWWGSDAGGRLPGDVSTSTWFDWVIIASVFMAIVIASAWAFVMAF